MKLRLLAWVATGAISLSFSSHALATGCGCQSACDSLPAEVSGCDCCGGSAASGGSFSHGLQKLHSRFKKLCGSTWSHLKGSERDETYCDDACDAALMGELMLPPSEVMSFGHPNSLDNNHDAYVPPVRPRAMVPPSPTAVAPVPPTPIAPVPVSTPTRLAPTKEIDNDLFDALPDPFVDDEVQLQTRRSIRPSSHEEAQLRPVPRRNLSQSQTTSSRRAKSVR